MITGTIKSHIDQIWNTFWSGGISNPLEVIEQITYPLFLRRLDDLHTLEENKSARLGKPMARRVFPDARRCCQRTSSDRVPTLVEFVNLIVDHLTEHGVTAAALLYESPFTDLTPRGPEALFTPAQVDELVSAVDSVRSTANAA